MTLTRFCRLDIHPVRAIVGGLALLALTAAPASAQAPPDPNPGALTFSGAFDVPTLYYLPRHPAGNRSGLHDVAVRRSEDRPDVGRRRRSRAAAINFGVWNSLHTGTSGTGRESTEKLHYEEDFYAALTLGFAKNDELHHAVHRVHESEREVHDGEGDPVQGLAGQQVRARTASIAFEFDTEPASGRRTSAQRGAPTSSSASAPAGPLGGGRATRRDSRQVRFERWPTTTSSMTGRTTRSGSSTSARSSPSRSRACPANSASWNFHVGARRLRVRRHDRGVQHRQGRRHEREHLHGAVRHWRVVLTVSNAQESV